MQDNLFLTGFMGAGKSTLARHLASLLHCRLVDMDQVLKEELGVPIAQFFEEQGEQAFRRAEEALLARLARRRGLVVATGGGLPQNPANRALMRRHGRIVFLSATLATLQKRLAPEIEAQTRPLWREPAAVEWLFKMRQGAYADCDLRVEVDGLSPEEAARQVLEGLGPGGDFPVLLDGAVTPVLGTFQGPAALARVLAQGPVRRVAFLSESRVAPLHLAPYQAAVDQAGIPATTIIVPPGERSKSLPRAARIYQRLLDDRLERGDLLVAVGGGMTTDLGAYVAATYKRGMDFLLVSTSLLGAVDAAVGGKAAVNLGQAKNVVGLFTRPRAVILDLAALATLPRAQRAEGLVEAYKTGLVADPGLAALVAAQVGRQLAGDLFSLAAAALASARAKARVVGEDFREKGLRRILNLGHTYGHAVEGFHRYRVSHGRAVAAGLVVAAAVSRGRGLLPPAEQGAIAAAVSRMFPRLPALPPLDQAWELMQNDKKNAGGKVVFVLLTGPGRPVVVNDVDQAELARAVAAVAPLFPPAESGRA
ncbi:MAG: bifunctional shikimate kinase/3-dehydroquinate synthase [Deltaproteobacteria bacterium]|nr:bifunctional shikimate kinase/3-dehydroquinate synthase [Deltaproteobacteria bacterium]